MGETPISELRCRLARPAALRAAPLLLALAAVACVGGPRVAPPQAAPPIELVGLLELPAEVRLDGVPLGGLSALTPDEARDRYFALADDPGEFGPPRFYQLRLAFGSPTPTAEALSWQPLRSAGGEPYADGMADPEGIARLSDGSLLVASEGLSEQAVAPFLRRFATDGSELARIQLPDRYMPTANGERGVRPSLGFESLALGRGESRLYLATEGALAQDGPAANLEAAGAARLLVLSWPEAEILAEHAYPIEPLRLVPDPADAFLVGGLVELLALGPGRLLALERQFAVGAGFSLRLYAIGLAGATDIRDLDSLAPPASFEPVCKELLLDFADLGIELGNLEGLAWGPALTDGRGTLIVVQDDNFDAGPAARFLRLAPTARPGISSWLALAQRCW